jgi:hypothetical protein
MRMQMGRAPSVTGTPARNPVPTVMATVGLTFGGLFMATPEEIIAKLRVPTKSVPFTVCGYTFDVPELTLDLLEKIEVELNAIKGGMTTYEYSRAIGDLIAKLFDLPQGSLYKMTLPEIRDLPNRMTELYVISGFIMLGEVEAAMETENPGTGTPTPSPQSLPDKESAAEILIGSNEPIVSEPTASSVKLGRGTRR